MIIIITIIIMHLAGSPGSYFAYLKDCLEEWSKNKKLECTLSMAEQKILRLKLNIYYKIYNEHAFQIK